jgi:hypothetical protein
VRIDTGPGAAGTPDRLYVWSPFLGCDDSGSFYAGWMDGRDFLNPLRGGHPGAGWWQDGRCNRTLDYGTTWLPADRLINSWSGNYPRCAMPVSANDQSGHVYTAWYSAIDQPTYYNQIRFNRSSDFGATWGTEVRLDSAPPQGASEWYPAVACDESGRVYVLWESSSRGQIRFNRSQDHGATWLASDLRVDTDPAGLTKGSVALASDQNGNVFAAWRDCRDAGVPGARASIYFNRSADHGMTWGVSDIRIDGMSTPPNDGPEYGPQIACTEDGMVYVLWEDKRYGGEWDIFFARSTDYGATWEVDQRLDTDAPGAYRSFRPQLACDENGGVYAAWEDWRGGYHHIYMSYSTDRGATWLPGDRRVDTDVEAAHAEWPRLCATSAGTVYVAWGFRKTTWAGDCADIHFRSYVPTPSAAPFPDLRPAPAVTCSPNPLAAGGEARIAFTLPEGDEVSVSIHGLEGRQVRLLQPRGFLPAGPHATRWDGRGDGGRDLASGVYFARLTIGSRWLVRRIVLLK